MEKFKKWIMGENRHHFIYGYKTDERRVFCQELEKDYPILLNKDNPMAIYLEEYGFPKLEINNELEKYLIITLSREYLNFLIARRILVDALNSIGSAELNSRMSRLITLFNRNFRNSKFSEIKSIEDMMSAFQNSIDFYLTFYKEYVLYGRRLDINIISIPFIDLDFFIRTFKEELDKKSYFAVIIDNNHEIALSSTKEINDLVGSRINDNISMKVVTDPDDWKSYVASSRSFIEMIHDYGTIELDDSMYNYVKKLKTTRLI